MSGDSKVIDLPEKFSIDGLMREAAARVVETAEPVLEPEDDEESDLDGLPAIERLSPLPLPGDPYKAFSRPSNKPLPTLCLLKSDGTIWSYPYSCRVEGPHLVPDDDAAKNLVVVLKFSGNQVTEVTLEGRKLEQLLNYLAFHRTAWVREQPKGKIIRDDNAPVVTGITIKNLER